MTSAVSQQRPLWLDQLQRDAPTFAPPARGAEAYRHLDLKALTAHEWQPAGSGARVAALPLELPGARLVFVDGQLAPQLSKLDRLPAGVSVIPFSAAGAAEPPAGLGSLIAASANPFVALNLADLTDGAYVHIARDTVLAEPIHVLWLSAGTPAAASAARLLVAIEAGARAAVVEQFAEVAPAPSRVCSVTELLVAENASLQYSRLQNASNSVHFGACTARLQAGARFDGIYFGGGSPLCRVDVTVDFAGRGAFAELGGVYMPGAGQQVDYHTNIEHAVPDCGANENFRGLVGANGRAIFNGRIHIHRQAQKSNSQLSNKNLLLSQKAEIYTKPELEIYADDVKCAHGATVAQLNDEALHYLRSRGIDSASARALLSFGFVNEVVENIANDVLRECVTTAMRAQFERLHRESAT